ncbi:Uncharacterised protein [Candidatus Anstonella stagnisolia]|nr:Uncharacterised protein [Candidatus Anstonella stagnisolia]
MQINLGKRANLLKSFNSLAKPGMPRFGKRVALFEHILDGMEHKRLVGMKGLNIAGKTSVCLDVQTALEAEGHSVIFEQMVRNFSDNDNLLQADAIIFDEATKLIHKITDGVNPLEQPKIEAFFALLANLQAKSKPVFVSYHPIIGATDYLEQEFGIQSEIISSRLTQEALQSLLTLPFIDTGISLSQATISRVIELSGGIILMFNTIVRDLLRNVPLNKKETATIDREPSYLDFLGCIEYYEQLCSRKLSTRGLEIMRLAATGALQPQHLVEYKNEIEMLKKLDLWDEGNAIPFPFKVMYNEQVRMQLLELAANQN